MKRDEISKARSQLVFLHNDIIRKARTNLQTELEKKIVAYIASKIRPDDEVVWGIDFVIRDFCEVCGIQYSGKNYNNVRNALKKLRDRSMWVNVTETRERTVAWFDYVEIEKGSGTVTVKISELLGGFFLELKNNFAAYELFWILGMNSKYAIDLYQLMRSYQSMVKVTIDIDELKERLQAEKYVRWADFMRKVLDPATSEINKYTDIKVSYKPLKKEGKGKKWAAIEFTIREKPTTERMKAVDAVHAIIDPDQKSLFPKEDPVSKALRGETNRVEAELTAEATEIIENQKAIAEGVYDE